MKLHNHMQHVPPSTYFSPFRGIHSQDGFFPLYASLFLFMISVACYGGLFFLNRSQDQAQQDFLEHIRLKAEDVRPKLLDQIFSLEKRLKNVGGVISTHKFSSNTLPLIESSTHPRVWFKNYRFDDRLQNVVMAGEAADFAVLARQISFFENNPQVEKLEFGGLTVTENRSVAFNLILFLKPTLLSVPPAH